MATLHIKDAISHFAARAQEEHTFIQRSATPPSNPSFPSTHPIYHRSPPLAPDDGRAGKSMSCGGGCIACRCIFCRLASASTVLIRAVSMRYFERKFSSVWAHASFCEGVVLAANASMKLASVDREKESRGKKGHRRLTYFLPMMQALEVVLNRIEETHTNENGAQIRNRDTSSDPNQSPSSPTRPCLSQHASSLHNAHCTSRAL